MGLVGEGPGRDPRRGQIGLSGMELGGLAGQNGRPESFLAKNGQNWAGQAQKWSFLGQKWSIRGLRQQVSVDRRLVVNLGQVGP